MTFCTNIVLLYLVSCVVVPTSALQPPSSTKSSSFGMLHKPVKEDENSDVNSMLFEISAKQRRALLSLSDPKEFDSTWQEIANRIRETFDEEGVVVIRGLLDDDMVDELAAAAQSVVDDKEKTGVGSFETFKFGPVFWSPPGKPRSQKETDDEEKLKAFREVALLSALPRFIGKVLMGLNEDSENNTGSASLRVLKDVLLVKGSEADYAGWHVDDSGFWPTFAKQTPSPPHPGVNAWIALDDMPAKFGGGLAVSPRSHRANWRHEAYETIGSIKAFPDGGQEVHAPGTKDFVLQKTTIMQRSAPDLHERIDATKKVFDFRKGDVLIHTRWIFHRSVPISQEGMNHFEELERAPIFKRYSIRYELGSARLLKGSVSELAVLSNPNNAGKTLDDVCQQNEPWYPRCWPREDVVEMENMSQLVTEKFPPAEKLLKEHIAQMFAIFRKQQQS